MKRLMRSLLLAAVLCTVLCVGALAVDSEPVKGGIYDIQGSGAALTPKSESGAVIEPGSGGEITSGYYADAVKFDVTANSLVNDQQYLLLVIKGEGVPTAENIAYIDQAAAQNGSVSFTAYPSALTKGTYHVYLVGAGMKFAESKVASFEYDQKYTLGDVDDDGYWTANDALYTLQIAVNKVVIKIDGIDTPVTDVIRAAADTDKDGYATANDALLILQKAVGKNVF